MPTFEDPEYGEYYVHIPDAEARAELNSILWGAEYETDPTAQQLFHDAFFDHNEAAYQDLIDYMWDEYGINFEDAFEWADFRAAYEAA